MSHLRTAGSEGHTPRRIRGTERLLSLSVLAVAALFGCARLGMWLVEGRHEGALPVTLGLGALLVALLGTGLLMHVPSFELALATVAWSLCASVITELSPYAAAGHIGSGPAHVPVYLGLALITGIYALGLPRAWIRPADPASRAAGLLAFWTTANVRMFERDGETAVPLLAGAVLLVLGTRARYRLRDLLSGPGWVLPLALLAMFAWWSLATVFGDSWRLGASALSHLAIGMCLAWALATSLDSRGVRTAFAGLVLGLASAHLLLFASVLEMLPFNEPIRIFGSRLSLFDRHPNQVAPLFTVGACLLAPLAFRSSAGAAAGGHRLPRAVPLLLFVLCLLALAWTQSRGAVLALIAGLAAALIASRGLLPRNAARFGLAALALTALAVGAFVSPLGDGLRAALEQQTHSQSAIGQRYHLWRSASAAVAEHPWLGLGPSQYYPHARYAQPSYYDGTFQDVHPHSLFFASAESAGLPGLALVLVVLVGLLELGRRRILGARAGPEKRILIGLFAATVAMLATNAVDFQGGASLLPIFTWVALGLFAAAGRPADTQPTRAPAAGALGTWLALAPLCAMPLFGTLAVDWAVQQPAWTATRIYEVVRWLHPWNSRAMAEEIEARIRLGQRREVLELVAAEARGSPERLGGQIRYGLMLLETGQTEQALELLERAQLLDPLGTRAGMTALALARVYAALGDEARFRATFLKALTLPEGQVLWMPHEPLPPQPGDPAGSRRVGFRIGGEGGHLVPADELLADLGERALSMIESDEVNARRLLGRVVDGYRSMGLTHLALGLVDRYTERAPSMFSMTVLRIDLLCELGDYEAAAEVYHAYPGRAHPYMTVFYLRGIGHSDDPELQREFRELPINFVASRDTDLFFTADQAAPVFEAQAERALVFGRIEEALSALERALYHYPSSQERLRTAESFFDRAVSLDAPDEVLLKALAVLLREANLQRAVTHDSERMNRWALSLRAAWDEALEPLDMPFELERVLRRGGPAGRALGAAWNRTEAGH